MKFRKVDRQRWQSMNGRYEIWVQARIRQGDGYEYEYAAKVVGSRTWLGETFTHSEAMTACRSHAAEPGVT